MSQLFKVALFAFFILAPQASPAVDIKPANKKPARILNPSYPCKDWASIDSQQGSFSGDGLSLYFLAMLGKSSSSSIGTNHSRFGVFHINLTTLESKLYRELLLPESGPFGVFGTPVNGATLLGLPGEHPCLAGGVGTFYSFAVNQIQDKSEINAITANKSQKFSMLKQEGEFYFVDSTKGKILFDHGRRALITVDFPLMQQAFHNVKTESENEYPLFIDLSTNSFYTWAFGDSEGHRGLIAYTGQGKVLGRMAFDPEARLLRQDRYFAGLEVDDKKNIAKVIELGTWSGKKVTKEYQVHAASTHDLGSASYEVNLQRRILVIKTTNLNTGLNWQLLSIHDYEKGWQLGELKAPTNYALGFSGISPDGALIFVEILNPTNKMSKELLVFSIASKKWLPLRVAF